MPSPSIEDYLKAIYNAGHADAPAGALAGEARGVTTQDIADRVGVSAPAVSKMLRKLAELHLAEHTRYQGVRLTEAGEKMALEIIRHHRLLELYLMKALGYSWDEVHDEAERLEHHISEEFEARIDAFLGYPTTDPHGDPIPTREGRVAPTSRSSLADQTAPASLTIHRVTDEDAALLRHLKELGLLPGAAIEFIEREPYGGAFVVRVGGTVVRVGHEAAEQIFVGPGGAPDRVTG